ncbi:nicotinate (nicotinamide) nucleotide adenylyltransferase [Coprobacter sp.]
MKIGIFSGSFNPIHIGHLIIANYLCEFEGLDEIWFIVSPQNPLKSKDSLMNDIHRVVMVKEAIRENRKFKFCDIEFSLPLPSYTIQTLKALEEKYPQNEFYLIIGSDNWLIFDHWKDYKEILKNYPVLIYPRFGYEIKTNRINLPGKNVRVTKSPVIDISSTFIREGISKGKNMNYYMPSNVYQYILSKALYQSKR